MEATAEQTAAEQTAAEAVLAAELAALDLSWSDPQVVGQIGPSSDGRRWGDVLRMDHAASVFESPLVIKDLTALRQTFERLRPVAGSAELLRCERKQWTFHVERPSWKSDIAWVAANDAATFRAFFQAAFDQLGVARRFGFLGEMRLFSGFFVSRRSTLKSHFHTDFSDTNGSAFTLMTPLYDMGALPDCQLLCKASDGAVMQYRYALGRAIVFGDGFVHATETGVAPRTLAFLCFTFGDRRMTPEQWANAEAYIEAQSPIYQTPAGKLVQSRLASVRGKAAC